MTISPATEAALAPASQDEVDRLIEQFDPESNFRRLVGVSAGIVTVIAVCLSSWHYYTAGFGLHNEIAHRAIHLSVVLGLNAAVAGLRHWRARVDGVAAGASGGWVAT